MNALIKRTICKHQRIIFNGNNYSPEWAVEAEKRGLSCLNHTVDALPKMLERQNIDVFLRQGVYSESEIRARYEILLENYCKCIRIEALTLIDMVQKEVLPRAIAYQHQVASAAMAKKSLNSALDVQAEEHILSTIARLCRSASERLHNLTCAIAPVSRHALEQARHSRDVIFSEMNSLRSVVDELELIVAKDFWAYPSYAELLYSII